MGRIFAQFSQTSSKKLRKMLPPIKRSACDIECHFFKSKQFGRRFCSYIQGVCPDFQGFFSKFHRFFPDFIESCPDFHQIKTFRGAFAPSAVPSPSPVIDTVEFHGLWTVNHVCKDPCMGTDYEEFMLESVPTCLFLAASVLFEHYGGNAVTSVVDTACFASQSRIWKRQDFGKKHKVLNKNRHVTTRMRTQVRRFRDAHTIRINDIAS